MEKEPIKNLKCRTEGCDSVEFQRRGKVNKSNLPRVYCKKCQLNFSKRRPEKEVIRFYRVRAIQLYLEGVSIATIADCLSVTNAYVNFLLGAKMGVEYLKRLRLDMDLTNFLYLEPYEVHKEIMGRKVFVLDGIPTERFMTATISHDDEFYELQKS